MIRLDDLLTGKEASPGHDTMSLVAFAKLPTQLVAGLHRGR